MNRSRIAILLVALCGALLTVPATASASDQSVFDTWNGAHAEKLAKAINRHDRAAKRAGNGSRRAIRRVLRTIPPLRRLVAKVATAVRGESASSDNGRSAKKLILRSLAAWRSALRLEARAWRALLRGSNERAGRLFKRVQRVYRRSERYAKRAQRLLREEGVETDAQ